MQLAAISHRENFKKTLMRFLGLGLVLLLAIAFYLSPDLPVCANREQDLRSETERLEAEITANEAVLNDLHSQALTLNNKLKELNAQIAGVNSQIQLTSVEIETLSIELDKATAELARQKGILEESLKTLYIEGNISTLDLLLASEDFSEFVNQQEYLSQLKVAVQESTQQVQLLKDSISVKKTETEALLAKQQAYKDELIAKQNEQSYLLNKTRGDEQTYQATVADLEKRLEAAENALNDYLLSLIGGGVSLGPVSAGDVIGTVGMSGCSSGAHLHFKVYTPSTTRPGVDPISTINNFGWVWPVGSYGGYISQDWGCTSWGPYPYYNGCRWHDAIDIAGVPVGTPVYAAADGQVIHRGCLYEGTDYSTYGVIIDHENGYYSLSIHMVAPQIPAYDGCRANTYPACIY